jgi:hypothetical protein
MTSCKYCLIRKDNTWMSARRSRWQEEEDALWDGYSPCHSNDVTRTGQEPNSSTYYADEFRADNMFYLDDFGDIETFCHRDYDRVYLRRWCDEALSALVTHSDRTDNPEQAAFSVASATLRCVSFASVKWDSLVMNLARTANMNVPPKFLAFDLTDRRQTVVSSQRAIVCKTALYRPFYRSDKHIALPQFPRHEFDRAPMRASDRPLLCGFKGGMLHRSDDVRTRLLVLNAEPDCVVSASRLTSGHIKFLPSGVSREETPPGEVSYEQLLYDSKFALVPRGLGSIGYRLIESMNAGCIPVIIADDHVLPFSEILDYSSWAICINECDVERIPSILRERLCDVDRMQKEVSNVYTEYFSSVSVIIAHVIAIASRMS